ncbi:MerR family transcriptional regulator [Desulfospira joergensenii]|uniref:MerR family transcriptional regulator n=1 Tax=Desulfospira joergensenii TaxID=53329 RepID=UPI0003B74FDA|nr:MerR family transcriptional regulator [Desulfospira joergensenii]
MYTIGKLAKKFNLSRTALLHYDKIGLLQPSGRSDAGYRLYSEEDRQKLDQIRRFRETGLSLEEIRTVTASPAPDLSRILENRLDSLNREIRELRNQQQVIIKILKDRSLTARTRYMDRKGWTRLLKTAGLDEKGQHKWHLEFEKMSAEAHRDFLEQLGFSEKEIQGIKKWVFEYDEK